MSPRPRKVTDADIFAATQRAAVRLAPSDLTLAAIGAEAGVTAGALTQRFGSKRALLLAMVEQAAGGTAAFFAQLSATHRSSLRALRAYATCLADLAPSPAALARNLAYLQIDLADQEFRAHLAVQARATRAGLRALLRAAVAAGELIPETNPRVLARTVEATLSGSLLTWAFYCEGSTPAWLRADLKAILAPYLARRPQRRRRRRPRRRR